MSRRIAVALFLIGSRLAAQTVPPADSNDVKSPDAIIKALYESNISMVDRKQGEARFRSIMSPDARLTIALPRPQRPIPFFARTVDEYAKAAMAGPPRHGFNEHEIKRTTESFGNVYHAFSTYETFRDSSDTHPLYGINSIQLAFDGTRWWVMNVLWDNASPTKPIPAKYKP